MKTAIYLRVSTEEQAQKFGITAQRDQCRAMAKVKGWEIAREYIDELSGTLTEDDRPALADLLEDACAGEIGAVIVSGLDRLGRVTRLVLRLVDQLDSCGAELVSCKESLDSSTPAGRFVLRMFASLAELERDNIVMRTTEGRNARGRKDGERGGRVPMGYTRGENGVEIDRAGVEVVRLIFDMRENGSTLETIAYTLNARGIQTARGKRWHPMSVSIILRNEDKYRGGYRGQSKVCWPLILE